MMLIMEFSAGLAYTDEKIEFEIANDWRAIAKVFEEQVGLSFPIQTLSFYPRCK